MRIKIIDEDGEVKRTTDNLEEAVVIALMNPLNKISIHYKILEKKTYLPYEIGRYEKSKASGTIVFEKGYKVINIAGSPREAANLFTDIIRGRARLKLSMD
ncbi:MAG: hypothetical protein KAI71_01305 [Candidatus Pacebacteria bacterium]|nr:hypothetical protein [Candidatus Paceibacterota bacterium]